MTRVVRVERASRTNAGAGGTAGRLGRRVRSDPHVLLALALAIPTVLVNLLDHGPNEAALTLLALTFVAVQAGLTARTRAHGRPNSRRQLRRHGQLEPGRQGPV